jgi:hypothetical protein
MNYFKLSGIIQDVKHVHPAIKQVTIENRENVNGKDHVNFFKLSFFDRVTPFQELESKLTLGALLEVEGSINMTVGKAKEGEQYPPKYTNYNVTRVIEDSVPF